MKNYNMVVVPQEVWENVTSNIQEIKTLFQKKSEEEEGSKWIESTQARKMLGVSQKTWQTYRDTRAIPFSQFGRKIYVKKADIERFMQEHYINSNDKGDLV